VVGLIFQFHYLLSDFTALENVMLPAYMSGESRSEATARAHALIGEVDLSARADHYPLQLSGGERQRAAVARALVNDPRIILADEPTGNLDEANSRVVEEILFDLVRQHRKTLILVTHDHVLAGKADVHLHLEGGELHPK
jgi:lipoprotein-releasing system ATP-binding protein